MKDSHKNLSRTRIPATSESVDENGKSYQEMGLNLRSPNKPATRNFMSPTISAASKANPPRKKVLAERNQITDYSLQKTPNTDSKSTKKTPDLDSRAASVISSLGTTEIGNNDSDLRPYDPIKNYLSPRPEFLMYKPNRLQKILLRMENEDEVSSYDSSLSGTVSPEAKKACDEETDSLHASQEGFLKKEYKELYFNEDEVSSDDSSLSRTVSPEAKKACDEETDSLHASQEGSLKKEYKELDFNEDEVRSDDSSLRRTVSPEAKKACDEETDSLHASQEGSLKKEYEELDFSDEEFEEEEEEGNERKTGFLKLLLLMAVLVFSTSYIYSMNSPTPSPATQAIQEWQFRIHDLVYGLVKSFEGESGIFYSQRDLIVLNHTVIGYGTDAEELAEDVIRELGDSDEWSEVEEIQAGKFEVIKYVKDEFVEEQAGVVCEDARDLQMDTVEIPNVKSENVEVEGGQIEENIGVVEVYDHQIEGSDSSIDQQLDIKDQNIEVVFAQLVEEQAEESEDASDLKMNTGEISDNKIENVEQESGLVEENFELVEVYSYHQVELPDFSNVTERKEDGFLMDPVKEVEHEELNQEAIEVQIFEILNHGVEESLEEEEEAVEDMETESISRGVICVTLFSVVSASLALSFCFKKTRKFRQSSPPVFVPSIEPVLAEKRSLVVPDKQQKQIDYVDSYASRSHLVGFKKDVSDISYRTQEPSIELLSEFEVGSLSNSLRSGGIKSRMIDGEMSNQELGSTGDSARPELSDMSSASYGSYIAENKILKKQKLEGGGDYEHNKIVITTPVRRSTRIRNRLITST